MRHEAAESALHTKAAVQAAQGNYVGAAISEVSPPFSFWHMSFKINFEYWPNTCKVQTDMIN